MRTMFLGILLFIALTAFCVAAYSNDKAPKPLDLHQVVEAIRQVENWNGRNVGHAGERGPWQFTATAWYEFSKQPFAWASRHEIDCKNEQHRVALAKVELLAERLQLILKRATAYNIALAFTCGFEGSVYGHPSRAKKDYAKRVQNIYDELTRNNNP